jgi:phage-related protein
MTEQRVTPIFEGHDNVCTISNGAEEDQAKAFLDGLADKDRAKFQRYLEYLRDGLHVKSPENMRPVRGAKDSDDCGAEVHELKVHRNGGQRLYVVLFEKRWYVTHGLSRKPSDRDVVKQGNRALKVFHGK